ncbi:hypothetical protein FHS89_002267 [Rubricella aquisinus]|uniref:YhhN-like protein n=1 Tax=Rubricella aquisinus TaxID=2028108 RepID=A0A840WNP5_9RHOB|nr:hypothetical protein [Rubricella aquisinus]
MTKTAAMLLLSLVAVLSDAPLFIMFGILSATLGDFLVIYGYRWKSVARLRISSLAYMVAYGAYIVGFVKADAALGADFAYVFAFAIAFGAMVLSCFGPQMREISSPSVLFSLMVVAQFSVAYTLPPEHVLAWYGACLILISKALFGYELFLVPQGDKRRRLSSPAVWLSYFSGQALIVMGFA